MSTSSKVAVMATFALGVVIGLIKVQSSWTEFQKAVHPYRKQALQDVLLTVHPSLNALNWVVEPFQAEFQPDPSEPPTGTGGSGTR